MKLILFTNCHKECVERPTLFDTIESWKQTFGECEMEIYCDPNPFFHRWDEYAKLIKEKTGQEPIKTTGLADGWKRAIDGNSGYIFMCEGDWTFQNIEHTLDEITAVMEKDNIWCMLFNKMKNDKMLNGTKWQSYFTKANSFYCLTDRFSNNPNILNVEKCKKHLAHIDWTLPNTGRIEEELQRKVEIAVYGEYGKLATIKHTNMRRGIKKER